MRRSIRRVAVLGAAATMALAAAAPVSAQPSADPRTDPGGGASAGATTGPSAERARKVCARLPKLEARLDKVLARLQGGADEPGSVEFVKKRAERARAKGHTDLATALDSRAKARADMIPVLQKKQDGLPKLTEWCTSHGYGTRK